MSSFHNALCLRPQQRSVLTPVLTPCAHARYLQYHKTEYIMVTLTPSDCSTKRLRPPREPAPRPARALACLLAPRPADSHCVSLSAPALLPCALQRPLPLLTSCAALAAPQASGMTPSLEQTR